MHVSLTRGALLSAHALTHVSRPLARSRASKRWELNTVLIVNNNNRTTVGLANNTGQQWAEIRQR